MRRCPRACLVAVAAVAALASVSAVGAADPGKPSAYYTLTGTAPARYPSDDCLLTVCLGSPVELVRKLFGLENDRYAGPSGTTSGSWFAPRGKRILSLSADWDRVGSLTRLGIGIVAGHPRARVALARRLVLGRSTMGDVRRRFPSARRHSWSGENIVFYEYRAAVGGEGSELLVFAYSTELGGRDDPGRFGRTLDAKPVTEVTVCLRRSDCP